MATTPPTYPGGQASTSMLLGTGTEAPQPGLPQNALSASAMLPGIPPPPGAAAGPDYLSMFNQSLGQSRSAIQSQLQAALGDIANSQGRANQAIGQMPGQLNALYGAAQGQMNSDAGYLQQQLNGSGALSGFTMPSQGAYMQPVHAALSNTEAYNQGEVPLLQLGANDSFAKLRSSANQAAIGAQESLNSEDRNALAGFAGNQMQNQQAMSMAQYNALIGQSQAAQQNQYVLGQQANQAALANSQATQSPYLTTDAGNYSQAQLLAQQLSQAQATAAKGGKDTTAGIISQINKLRARDPGAVAAVLGGVKIG